MNERDEMCKEIDRLNAEVARLQSLVMTLRGLLNHSVIRSEIHSNHLCGVCPSCHMIYKLHTSTILETPDLPPINMDGGEDFPPEMLDEHITKMCAAHVAAQLAASKEREAKLVEALSKLVGWEDENCHSHQVPLTWDDDSSMGNFGHLNEPCQMCHDYEDARALLAERGRTK